jgi:EspG family
VRAPNAVELTAAGAWFVADAVQAGNFPWVLAITPPYRYTSERPAFVAEQTAELIRLGVVDAATGAVDNRVAGWVRVVCHPQQWLELRYAAAGSTELLRGIVARRGDATVVALRNAQLVTLTVLRVDEPTALVPILAAGLAGRAPARIPEFALPARVGARADEQLRAGAELSTVIQHLGVPTAAHALVESVIAGSRNYVEIVAGQNHDGVITTSEVGVAVIDTPQGRVAVSPRQAFDGEWVSTFTPGTDLSIACAVQNLTATLPAGQWFPDALLTREFLTLQT